MRTAKFFIALVAAYGALVSVAFWAPPALAEPAGLLLLLPFFTPHLLHKVGIPGLLEQGGHCGWGWCAPTVAGWIVLALLWLGAGWAAAWGLARIRWARVLGFGARSRQSDPP